MNFTDKLSETDPLQAFSLQFAPKDLTETLALFYVSFYEWHNIVKNASEPMIGQIKIQWWRDMLNADTAPEGAPPHIDALHNFLKQNPDDKTDILNILDALDEEFIFKTAQPKKTLGSFMQYMIKLHGIGDKAVIDLALHIFLDPHHNCTKHQTQKMPKNIRHLFFVYMSNGTEKGLWENMKMMSKILRFYWTGIYRW